LLDSEQGVNELIGEADQITIGTGGQGDAQVKGQNMLPSMHSPYLVPYLSKAACKYYDWALWLFYFSRPLYRDRLKVDIDSLGLSADFGAFAELKGVLDIQCGSGHFDRRI